MTRFFLLFFVVLSALLAAAGAYALHRLGGWRYALQRLQRPEGALYEHRKQLFERLPARPGAVLMVGDSHTEQCEWAELLAGADRLPPVLNRGIVGDQCAGVAARLEELLRHRPSRIFLQIGINDLGFGAKAPDAVAEQYAALVRRIRQQSPDSELILQSVFPVNNAVRDTRLDNAAVRALNARVRQLAGQYALPYLDVQAALADSLGNLDARYTADGLHLNGAGYLMWKAQLLPHLKF